MALWCNLHINDQRIGELMIRRRERLDLSDRAAVRDVVSTYEVSSDDRHVGLVRHRYGDGAWRLLAAAASLTADWVDAAGTPPDPVTIQQILRRVRDEILAYPGPASREKIATVSVDKVAAQLGISLTPPHGATRPQPNDEPFPSAFKVNDRGGAEPPVVDAHLDRTRPERPARVTAPKPGGVS